jgi:glutathione S-transferase
MPNQVLITFPPSLDSELSRFVVDHYGVQHREQRHTLVFSSFVTLWHGRSVVFPMLYGDAVVLVGPRAMIDNFDARCTPDLQLWPRPADERAQAERDWKLFNETLAFATAVFAYYHLLPYRDRMVGPLTAGTPDFERRAVERAYPVFAWLLRALLRLTAARAQESLDQTRRIFDAVEARLADGRRFLIGDRVSVSDIAFAVAAAPVVLPSGYGGAIPSFTEMPAAVQAVVTEMRARAAGVFALKIYGEQRYRGAARPDATA